MSSPTSTPTANTAPAKTASTDVPNDTTTKPNVAAVDADILNPAVLNPVILNTDTPNEADVSAPAPATETAPQISTITMRPENALYVIATPIGNLSDITLHAISALKAVDIIACEDTRTSGKLLANFSIDTQTWAYHEHNSAIQTPKIIEMIQGGLSVALISDAGTPLISDPGYQLVQAAHNAGVRVIPVVGACAAIGALSVAGLPSDKFSFVGFLPAKTTGRVKQLQRYANHTETLIFYEAPHRIVVSLKDMVEVFGETRPATLCRELTKTFETVKKATLGELAAFVEADPNQQKGEIVLVVGGDINNEEDLNVHDTLLLRLIEDLSVKKAAALAADITGVKKNALYKRLLELQKD